MDEMKQFENIENLMNDGFCITIEKELYGDEFLIGLDSVWHNNIAVLIDDATSPGDSCAMDALSILWDLKEKYPEILIVSAKTLNNALCELNNLVYQWNQLTEEKQTVILQELQEKTEIHKKGIYKYA